MRNRLRVCVATRQKTAPDAWTTFNTMSMLGGALLGQKKYADAEPLLRKGYKGCNSLMGFSDVAGAELGILILPPEDAMSIAPTPTTIRLPDHRELPCEDGAIVQNFQEHPQAMLLTDTMTPLLDGRHPDRHYCIGQDCGI